MRRFFLHTVERGITFAVSKHRNHHDDWLKGLLVIIKFNTMRNKTDVIMKMHGEYIKGMKNAQKSSKKSKRFNKESQRLKNLKIEADARRKVNAEWERVASLRRYKRAAVKHACDSATAMIQNECFDGILMQLNSRSESKSNNSQKRVLRRIIEKRQAQSIHRSIGRTIDRFSNYMQTRSISRSVSELRRCQYCA